MKGMCVASSTLTVTSSWAGLTRVGRSQPTAGVRDLLSFFLFFFPCRISYQYLQAKGKLQRGGSERCILKKNNSKPLFLTCIDKCIPLIMHFSTDPSKWILSKYSMCIFETTKL